MFVRMICKDRNEKEKNELYQVMGALCAREHMQIEEQADRVVIYACVQGNIVITEEDDDVIIEANTRHGGAGFHAFAVEFCKDIQTECPGEYELIDDLDFDADEDFHRLHHIYEDEIVYLKDLLLKNPEVRNMNYMYDQTYFLPIEKDGRISTAIGDMDISEFARMEAHDLMDSFFVWNDWEKNARYYKNAALVTLAKEGVGPYATMNADTIKHANEICDFIELANRKDPHISLPLDVYEDLCQQLGRQPQLEHAHAMEQEAIQYRTQEVYHLFDDVKVVADGACERSVDPVNEALCLMAPYKDESQWSWLLMASKKSDICSYLDELLHEDPISYDNKQFYFTQWMEDDATMIDALLEEEDRSLYFHAIIANPKDVPYIKQCIKESGFIHQA